MHLTVHSESTVYTLSSQIFFVFNVALLSYRDLNLQNANKMTSIQDFAIISTSIYNTSPELASSYHVLLAFCV